RDARLVLSTARSSPHRTGEFAVLGSARGAHIDVPRPSRPRWGGGLPSFGSGAHSRPGSRARADAPPCDSAICHTRALALPPFANGLLEAPLTTNIVISCARRLSSDGKRSLGMASPQCADPSPTLATNPQWAQQGSCGCLRARSPPPLFYLRYASACYLQRRV
ncbi:hypothetical protein EV122DRAFT_216817, partial [Schizophyllum commune]